MNITASRRRFSHMIVLAVVLAGFALSMSAIRKSYGDVTHRLAQPDLVASVEGHDISARVYEMYLKNGIESFGLIDAKPEGHRQIVQLKRGIIDELIDRALIQAEAERRGLTVDADKFDSRYRQRIEEMGGE